MQADSLAPAAPLAVQVAPVLPVPASGCSCAALSVAWREAAPGIEVHDARDAIVVLVPFGKAGLRLTVRGAEGELGEVSIADPEVCVLAPRIVHGFTIAQRTEFVVLCLDRAAWQARAQAVLQRPGRVADCHVGRDPFVRTCAERLAAAARFGAPPDPAWLEAAADDLAVHVAARHGRPPEDARLPALQPDRLQRVLALIDERLAEAMQVRDLAAAVRMSPYHFARLFKQATGQAPHVYITWQRMERAKELLAQSDLPLAEVARHVGYRTQAHFTGVFHARVGTTPRAYRLRSRALAAR
jgi:AraC family transcriptional regulator